MEILDKEKSFTGEIKSIFHDFYRAFIETNFFGRWESDFKLNSSKSINLTD